jgi:hypothetical protein
MQDAQFARILNEHGPARGRPVTPPILPSVQWIRYTTKPNSLKGRFLEAGMLTKRQLSTILGVSRTTISKLRTLKGASRRADSQTADRQSEPGVDSCRSGAAQGPLAPRSRKSSRLYPKGEQDDLTRKQIKALKGIVDKEYQ